jgi:hypothetical protein
MGQFTDLIPDQAQFLCALARAIHDLDYEVLRLQRTMGNRSTIYAMGRQGAREVMSPAPFTDTFYTALLELRYITLTPGKGWYFRLTRRALDYVAYAAKSDRQRRWADFVYDLGHDDTVRSKALWALGSVVIANVGTIVMSLLGWI